MHGSGEDCGNVHARRGSQLGEGGGGERGDGRGRYPCGLWSTRRSTKTSSTRGGGEQVRAGTGGAGGLVLCGRAFSGVRRGGVGCVWGCVWGCVGVCGGVWGGGGGGLKKVGCWGVVVLNYFYSR
jgi:hypothetical protein